MTKAADSTHGTIPLSRRMTPLGASFHSILSIVCVTYVCPSFFGGANRLTKDAYKMCINLFKCRAGGRSNSSDAAAACDEIISPHFLENCLWSFSLIGPVRHQGNSSFP